MLLSWLWTLTSAWKGIDWKNSLQAQEHVTGLKEIRQAEAWLTVYTRPRFWATLVAKILFYVGHGRWCWRLFTSQDLLNTTPRSLFIPAATSLQEEHANSTQRRLGDPEIEPRTFLGCKSANQGNHALEFWEKRTSCYYTCKFAKGSGERREMEAEQNKENGREEEATPLGCN